VVVKNDDVLISFLGNFFFRYKRSTNNHSSAKVASVFTFGAKFIAYCFGLPRCDCLAVEETGVLTLGAEFVAQCFKVCRCYSLTPEDAGISALSSCYITCFATDFGRLRYRSYLTAKDAGVVALSPFYVACLAADLGTLESATV
jgi:hypothetical protein